MITAIKNYFKRRADKKAELKAKTDNLIKDYNKLIDEYRLIQEKKSKLSRRERKMVEARIIHLIGKGHIVVGKPSEI
jgi:hypothetical protein